MTNSNHINRWMTPKELTQLEGMPSTIQGIHKRASKEGWPRRPQQGRRGPGVEYLIASNEHTVKHPSPPEKNRASVNDIVSLFGLLVSRLSEQELNELGRNLAIKGLAGLIHGTSELSKEAAFERLGITQSTLNTAKMLESISPEARREILAQYGISEQGSPVAPEQEPHKKAV